MSSEAPTTRLDAVKAVADKDPKATTAEERSAALEWFLSSEVEETAWAYLPVNVSAAGQAERIVDFKIQVLDRDRIKQIRDESRRTNADGVLEMDEMEANLRIAVEGLIEPNLRKDERLRVVRGQQFLDPADALKARFTHKPGIIDQIAGKIIQISGYNDADVKEIRAAGN